MRVKLYIARGVYDGKAIGQGLVIVHCERCLLTTTCRIIDDAFALQSDHCCTWELNKGRSFPVDNEKDEV